MARVDIETEFSENELLKEIESTIAPELDTSKEICIDMLVGRGVSKDQARLAISKMKSKLSWHWARYNGQRVKAYRKID